LVTVTPISGQADDLLICLFCSRASDAAEGGNAVVTYTAMPVGMTAYTERDAAPYITYRAASQILISSGATGTRTATADSAKSFQTVSVLVKSSAAVDAAPPYPGLLTARLRPYFG